MPNYQYRNPTTLEWGEILTERQTYVETSRGIDSDTNPDGYADLNYYRVVTLPYAGPPSCNANAPTGPELVGVTAEYTPTQTDAATCAVTHRRYLQGQIDQQVPSLMPADVDEQSAARTMADKATTHTIALSNTADADLGNFNPNLMLLTPSVAFAAQVQVDALQNALTIDDHLAAIGDEQAYTTGQGSEREKVEDSLKQSMDALRAGTVPQTPPSVVREHVHVPDEQVDKLLVFRKEWTEAWPGHFISATLVSDDDTESAAARIVIYSETGTSLGVYPFVNNGDGTWTMTTQSTEGQRTPDPRILDYEFLWGTGSASVFRRQRLTVPQQDRRHKVRYSVAASGRNKPVRR